MASDWSARWLDLIESSPTFPDTALRRGSDYVAFDWQLDVEIEPGRATTTATSGRMQYDAVLTVPVLAADEIAEIVADIASSTERLAAVLDGELPPGLDRILAIDPGSLRVSCTCRSVDRPCKHAAAVAHLVADAIADDPFDLLHLRGLPRADLVEKLAASRRAAVDPDTGSHRSAEPVGDDVAEPVLRFTPARGRLPADLPLPSAPGRLPPFPTPPPAGASFTEKGLRLLADDGAARAFDLLTAGSIAWTDLDPTADLARRAAALDDEPDPTTEQRAEWKALVERAQVTSQELRARAEAWRVGGAVAVSAHVAPVEVDTDPDDRDVQWRRTSDGFRVRFHKVRGRWLAHSVHDRPVERPTERRQ